MRKTAKVTGLAASAIAMSMGVSVISAPTASAAFTRTCVTIPARDFTINTVFNFHSYPPRGGIHVHYPAHTICHTTWVRTSTSTPTSTGGNLNFKLGRINFRGLASAV